MNRLPHAGSRAESPFAGINCAAIPKKLFESEGVGYSPGAFPGARKEGSTGKIEVSHQGTLFLEEMGDLSLQRRPSSCAFLRKSVRSAWGLYEKIKKLRTARAFDEETFKLKIREKTQAIRKCQVNET